MGSCRRELLDHVIPLNERRLGRDYLAYYHEDRTQIGLEKETPAHRPIESRLTQSPGPLSVPRIGGLHHRYTLVRSGLIVADHIREYVPPFNRATDRTS